MADSPIKFAMDFGNGSYGASLQAGGFKESIIVNYDNLDNISVGLETSGALGKYLNYNVSAAFVRMSNPDDPGGIIAYQDVNGSVSQGVSIGKLDIENFSASAQIGTTTTINSLGGKNNVDVSANGGIDLKALDEDLVNGEITARVESDPYGVVSTESSASLTGAAANDIASSWDFLKTSLQLPVSLTAAILNPAFPI